MEQKPDGTWYSFIVKGKLDRNFARWFEGMEIIDRQDETELRGFIQDRAALFGTINRFRDLGLYLLSVSRIHAEKEK